MKPNEIIKFSVEEDRAERIVKNAVEYAVFSIPFTINRMNISHIERRIINIAKGKLAEGLFRCFVEDNNIQGIDFTSTQTPYYQIDKGDFIFEGYEWDIKNNFIYCKNFSDNDIMNFLALIPHRSNKDQWGRRFEINFPDKASNGKAFLFTFIKRSINFDINIPEEILKVLKNHCNKYRGRPQKGKPNNFENEMQELLTNYNIEYRLNYDDLELIITGYATETEFDEFREIPEKSFFGTSKGEKCFTSRIKNKGVEIKKLPSFKSLISNGE